jgi:hemolysin D
MNSGNTAAPKKRKTRRQDELAFLPAALEITETPPSPIGYAIGLTIIAMFSVALAWACFGHIDIVATATGKIVPSGRTKTIQPFETGVVRAIHVQDGQTVAAGDILIELDPTINEAERNHLRSDLTAAQLDIARLKAVLGEDPQDPDPLTRFRPPEAASPMLVSMQRQLLLQQVDEQRAKLAALDRQKAQKQAELATVRANANKLEAVLPVLKQRVDIRETLYSHETGSKANYLEILQAYVESQHELEVQKSRLQEAEAAIAAITEARAQTAAEFRRTLFAELVEAERKASGLSEDLVKATQRTQLQALTAPVDGTVQQLAVHTVGGVVTPAQALMVLVPSDSHLEVEAMLSNRDIGFIHPGQDVEIKVDTFPCREHVERAQGAGTYLFGAHFAQPHADASGRKSRQSLGRHGHHGRDQDWVARRHHLLAVAAAALQAGEPAGAVSENGDRGRTEVRIPATTRAGRPV